MIRVTADAETVRIESDSPGPCTGGPAHIILAREHASELQKKLDAATCEMHDTGERRRYGEGNYFDAKIIVQTKGGTRIGEGTTPGWSHAASIMGFCRDGTNDIREAWIQVQHSLSRCCGKNLSGCATIQLPFADAKKAAKAIRSACGWSVDDALAGDLDAIEENLKQMVGALHGIDTTGTVADGKGFVLEETLNGIARLCLLEIDAEGRVRWATEAMSRAVEVGQSVVLTVSRAVPSPFAPGHVQATDQDYADRAMLSLRLNTPPGQGGTYLYLSPPALAVRAWAKRRTDKAPEKS